MYINGILKLTNIPQKMVMLQIIQGQNFEMFLASNSVFYLLCIIVQKYHLGIRINLMLTQLPYYAMPIIYSF